MIVSRVEPTYLGVGLYSIPEAARIVGVPHSTLRSWVKSYTRTTQGREVTRRPVIARVLGGNEPILTFIELVELLSVKAFRSVGVSMGVIRKAAQRGSERLDTPYPFASHRFETDGKHIFAIIQDEERGATIIEEAVKGQRAIEELIRPLFHKFDYRDDQLIHAFWPRTKQGRVILDPLRAFGRPLDAETGISTATLYEAAQANPHEPLTRIAWWFDAPVQAVEAAVDYERSLLQAA